MSHDEIGIWLRALKSGIYNQCQGDLATVALHTSASVTDTETYFTLQHCCLGVLSSEFDVNREGALEYPFEDPRFLVLEREGYVLTHLNDTGPMDGYQRVIAELEGALEVYITR